MLDESSFREMPLGSRLPAGLRGTFKDLSREIRFSPDLQPRCIPAFRRFSTPHPTPLPRSPRPSFYPRRSSYPPTPVSIPFGVSTPRRSPRRGISRLSLARGTFRRELASIVASRYHRDPRIGPLSPELSVNALFAASFLRLPPPAPAERKRKRN